MDTFIQKIKSHNIPIYNNTFIIEKCIGSGASCEVYKCLINNKLFAAKKIKREYCSCYSILDEIIINYSLKSKRIVKTKGIYITEKDIYIIMEYLIYGDLFDYVTKYKLSLENKIKLFKSMTLAVKDLHDNNIIHCDLKLDNLAYYYDIQKYNNNHKKYVKILDFNLSLKSNHEDELIKGWIGTYGYSSPEQHKYKICKKSDIYSLGVIFLEILLDKSLWDNTCENNYQKCRKQIMINLKESKKYPNIYKIIKNCLSSDPKKRMSSENLFNAIKLL